ncbi:nucleotide pyrophosphohydrolase [Taylorella equigenitalis]|uniref:Pyrophosphatase n=2 Tax=Taylorella equigenitalis TaxID=29575 RepID=A0A654KJX6_TAYEM|nr:nucleotide pyrophosphohydrolase [Taylorella equigenitalis]ADU92206.1 pyrophosphatase [Taylorella equigenitalis MCE9]ASY30405.1 nucleotide pyrophosphohydrolase [Taylorella equigenitalis]ASY37711.1 nucleotide pyrophosphohydrolase [Taylorella equigenitalis]ASY42133.1 nucleotide pyrophosphohydrolase [Taylorella equigenitalis]KGK33283.1 nucleotide pyrophosphohydrolase [Taylorella equigenitalis]
MKNVLDAIDKFNTERNWKKFHSPENLAKSISIEAAELLEIFQWNTKDIDEEHLKEELADVLIYCLDMTLSLNIDPERIILDKLNKNSIKYPLEDVHL